MVSLMRYHDSFPKATAIAIALSNEAAVNFAGSDLKTGALIAYEINCGRTIGPWGAVWIDIMRPRRRQGKLNLSQTGDMRTFRRRLRSAMAIETPVSWLRIVNRSGFVLNDRPVNAIYNGR